MGPHVVMKEFLVNSDFGLGWQFINLGSLINRRLGLVLLPKLQGIRFYVHSERPEVKLASHEFGGVIASNQNHPSLLA